jgi:hypothetical protein
MPNDKRKLLENFRQDFPSQEDLAQIEVSAGEGGTLTVQSRLQKMPGLKVSMDVQGGAIRKEDQLTAWKNSP